MNAKTSQFNWPANLTTGHGAMATVDIGLTFPQKGTYDLVDGLDYPFGYVQGNEMITWNSCQEHEQESASQQVALAQPFTQAACLPICPVVASTVPLTISSPIKAIQGRSKETPSRHMAGPPEPLRDHSPDNEWGRPSIFQLWSSTWILLQIAQESP